MIAYVDGSLAVTNGLFRIRSITASNGVATVTWTSQDAKTYRLLYKDNLTVTNCSFFDNRTAANGGALSIENAASATISNSTFADNRADGSGI